MQSLWFYIRLALESDLKNRAEKGDVPVTSWMIVESFWSRRILYSETSEVIHWQRVRDGRYFFVQGPEERSVWW